MFKPLTRSDIGKITDLMLESVNERLVEKEITIRLTDEAKDTVITGGYDPSYGARPLKRYLQKHVETLAAKLILGGDIGRGDTIVIDAKDGELFAKTER